jgi:hypothetical protein
MHEPIKRDPLQMALDNCRDVVIIPQTSEFSPQK